MQENHPSSNRLGRQNDQIPPPEQAANRQHQPRSADTNLFRVGITQQDIAYIQLHKILFLSGKTEVINPKQQTYWAMLKTTFYPSLQLCSLTTALFLINIIVFIVEVSLGFDQSNTVLEVNYATLSLMGLNDSHLVYKGQVYRLVVAQFLHANLLHLVSNNIILILLVSRLQYSFGKLKVLLIYVLSGITGDIFSNILYTQQMLKVGSSTSLYGMIGLSIGYIIINWPAFRNIAFIFKFKIIFFITLLTILLLLFSDVAQQIDFFGHLGAFIAGLFLTCIIPTITSQKRQVTLRIIFGLLFIIEITAFFLFFYLLPNQSYQ